MTAIGVAWAVLQVVPPVGLAVAALLAVIGAWSLLSAAVDVIKAMTGWR